MLEILILCVIIFYLFGSPAGQGYPVYGRVSVTGLLLVLLIVWLLIGPHHERYYW